MANELSITEAIAYANGGAKFTWAQAQYQMTQTTQGLWAPIWTVGTAEEDMLSVDIGTNGWLFLKNLDATNFVKWGPKSGGAMIECGRLKPTEAPTLFRLASGVTIRAIADTAACKVQVALFAD